MASSSGGDTFLLISAEKIVYFNRNIQSIDENLEILTDNVTDFLEKLK